MLANPEAFSCQRLLLMPKDYWLSAYLAKLAHKKRREIIPGVRKLLIDCVITLGCVRLRHPARRRSIRLSLVATPARCRQLVLLIHQGDRTARQIET